ncbi:hypothetical protein [Diaphorobacter aerolatus]|uniref:Uncharacterized protein n=1 Tax=Diaphorobacter aerolatus TaxID=1288495 RepID=A0A7H0GLM6_9BURK|nr:hypothetical protein [Diaphorobacter aerolatus]QNP49192.1 hypothetical protein H9K75_03515 [Diaphorobacter aerolatus]
MWLQRLDLNSLGISKNPLMLLGSMRTLGVAAAATGLLTIFFPQTRRAHLLALPITLLAYLLIWQQFFPLGRYLLPILPLAAVLCALLVHAFVPQGWLERRSSNISKVMGTPLQILLLCGLLFAASKASIEIFAEKAATWQATLASRGGYEVFRVASERKKTPQEQIVQIGFENGIYFYDGVTIGDWFGIGRYSQFTRLNLDKPPYVGEIVAPQALLDAVSKFHVEMIAVNAGRFQFEPDKYRTLFEVEAVTPTAYLLRPKARID